MNEDSEERKRIRVEAARRGGKAAHAQKKAHEWTSDEARTAGMKGAQTTQSRFGPEHFSAVGRKGAAARWAKKREAKSSQSADGIPPSELVIPQPSEEASRQTSGFELPQPEISGNNSSTEEKEHNGKESK